PARLTTAGGRSLAGSSSAGEVAHIDLGLSRLVRAVGRRAAVRRDLRVGLVERRLEEGPGHERALAPEDLGDPDVVAALGADRGVDERRAVGRPAAGPVARIGRDQRLGLVRTVYRPPVD